MKTCSGCKETKDFKSFNRDRAKKDGLCPRCKTCANLATKSWQLANPDKSNSKNREWKKNNPNKVKLMVKKWSLKTNYGLSYEEYNSMLEQQDHSCYICKKNQKDLKKALAVDHDHGTGKIRGLLCSTCNSFLGYIGEKLDYAINIVNYIKRWK